jgi:hypothetical protein
MSKLDSFVQPDRWLTVLLRLYTQNKHPTLIILSGVGATCFSSRCDKD